MRKALFALLLAGCAAPPPAVEVQPRGRIDDAIADGAAFLVRSQRPDGGWGSGRGTRGFEIYSMVPGSHDAFRVATTGLCVMALRDAMRSLPAGALPPGTKEAHDRGVAHLVTKGEARRDSGDMLYNVWAHTYALQALSLELQDVSSVAPAQNGAKEGEISNAELKAAAEWQLDRLRRYETYVGGWFYYDFKAQTRQPSEGPSSFGTAAGMVALWEARKAGIEVEQGMIDRGLRRLEELRNPDGSYIYGFYLRYRPIHMANRRNGSLGRSQSGNFALWQWGSKKVGEKEAREGLDYFFEQHRFIEIGRKRQWPHEAWYATAPYYFFFGHYYAARLVEMLGDAGKRAYASKLAATVQPYQEPEGSWWDYPMWDYDKPYGTAYAILILARCRD